MLSALFLDFYGADPIVAQVVTFEGNSFPETEGWQRLPESDPHGERALEGGWLVQSVGLPEGWPGPTGDGDIYRMELTQFTGVESFFVEWRAITDNPSWLIESWQTPAAVAAGGNAASLYHTVMTDSAAAFLRDISIPRVIVPVTVESAHVYRVEVFSGAYYFWYIDGLVVNNGTPEGPYPDANASLVWGARREYVDATTAWDYVRYGVIPQDASGDYDSDGAVTRDDFYFFHECLTNDRPGINGGPENNAGPGCRFADFDGDGDVDLLDFAEFQNLYVGDHP